MYSMAENNNQCADIFFTTTCETEKYTFLWSIKHFSKLIKKSIELTSPVFGSEKGVNKRKWTLVLCTKEMNVAEDKPWIAFKLNIISETTDNLIETNIKISVRLSNNDISNFERTYNYPNTVEDKQKFNFLSHDQILKSETITQEDTLNIFCEILATSSSMNTVSEITKFECVPDANNLGTDLAKMLAKQSMCDVTIWAATGDEREEIKAHKNILAARSSVFNAMFKHKMQENVIDIIEIKDSSAKVVREMLNYIYTGSTSNINHLAADLLIAADKYDLKPLKTICEQSLYEGISINTAIDLLDFAGRYNAYSLKANVIRFMLMHRSEIIESDSWEKLIASKDRDLMAATMSALRQKTSH